MAESPQARAAAGARPVFAGLHFTGCRQQARCAYRATASSAGARAAPWGWRSCGTAHGESPIPRAPGAGTGQQGPRADPACWLQLPGGLLCSPSLLNRGPTGPSSGWQVPTPALAPSPGAYLGPGRCWRGRAPAAMRAGERPAPSSCCRGRQEPGAGDIAVSPAVCAGCARPPLLVWHLPGMGRVLVQPLGARRWLTSGLGTAAAPTRAREEGTRPKTMGERCPKGLCTGIKVR